MEITKTEEAVHFEIMELDDVDLHGVAGGTSRDQASNKKCTEVNGSGCL
ncbi:MAG TPA: hypothetical protein VL242_14800 [Sorangium sp.]|nr:hypothetical protein [Sorangium sp.]